MDCHAKMKVPSSSGLKRLNWYGSTPDLRSKDLECKTSVMDDTSRNLKSRVRHSCEDLVNWKNEKEEELEKETRHLEITQKLIKDQSHNLLELHLTVERLNMRIEQEETAKELIEPLVMSTEQRLLQIQQDQEQVKLNQGMIAQIQQEISDTHVAAKSELQTLTDSFNQLSITHKKTIKEFKERAEERRSLALAKKYDLQEKIMNKQALVDTATRKLAEMIKLGEEQKEISKKLQDDINCTQLQNIKLKEEIQELQSRKAKNVSQLTKEIEEKRTSNNEYLQDIAEKNKRFVEIRQAFEEAAEQICSLKKNNDLLEAYVDEQDQKIISLSEYNHDIEQNLSMKHEELEKVQNKSEEILLKVKELQNSNDVLLTTIKERQKSTEEIKESINNINDEKNRSDHMMEQRIVYLKKLQSEVRETETKIQTAQEFLDSNNYRKEEIVEFQTQVNENENLKSRLQKETVEIDNENKISQEKLENALEYKNSTLEDIKMKKLQSQEITVQKEQILQKKVLAEEKKEALQKELTLKKDLCDSCEQELKDIEDTINRDKKSIEEASVELSEMNLKANEFTENLNKIENEKSLLKKQLAEIEFENEKSKREISEKEVENDELYLQLKQLQEKKQNLEEMLKKSDVKDSIQFCNQKICEQDLSLKMLHDKKISIEKQLNKAKEERNIQTKAIQEKSKEIKKLQKEISGKKKTIIKKEKTQSKAQKDYEDSSKKLNDLVKTRTKKRDELEMHKAMTIKASELKAAIVNEKSRIENFKKTMSKLLEKLDTQKSNEENICKQNAEYELNIQKVKDEKVQVQLLNSSLEKDIILEKQKIDEINNQLVIEEKNCEDIQSQIQNIAMQKHNLSSETKTLEEKLVNELDRKKSLEVDNKKIESENKKLSLKIKKIRQNKNKISKEIKKIQEEKKKTKEENVEKQKNNVETKEKIKELQQIVNKSNKEIDEIKEEIKDLEEKNKLEIQETNELLKEFSKEMDEKISEKTEQIKGIKEKIKSVTEEKDKEISEKNQALEIAKTRLLELEKEIQHKREAIHLQGNEHPDELCTPSPATYMPMMHPISHQIPQTPKRSVRTYPPKTPKGMREPAEKRSIIHGQGSKSINSPGMLPKHVKFSSPVLTAAFSHESYESSVKSTGDEEPLDFARRTPNMRSPIPNANRVQMTPNANIGVPDNTAVELSGYIPQARVAPMINTKKSSSRSTKVNVRRAQVVIPDDQQDLP